MGVSGARDELGGSSEQVNLTFSVRPAPRLQLSVRPLYQRSDESQQYVTTKSGGRPETYGSRYVFAFIDRSTFSTQLRASFVATPNLTLETYAEPFAASGRYHDHGELLAPRSRERITYGKDQGTTSTLEADGSRTIGIGGSTFTLANADFNVRSFNSNVVLKWEWRPGSTVYLVWQQSRAARDPFGTHVDAGDMFGSVTAPGSNILLFKTSFWLPIG